MSTQAKQTLPIKAQRGSRLRAVSGCASQAWSVVNDGKHYWCEHGHSFAAVRLTANTIEHAERQAARVARVLQW